MPTIDLPADELAAVTAAIRRLIEDDKYPHAPRLDPLRAALARLEAALKQQTSADSAQVSGPPHPKAPPAPKPTSGRGDNPARTIGLAGGPAADAKDRA